MLPWSPVRFTASSCGKSCAAMTTFLGSGNVQASARIAEKRPRGAYRANGKTTRRIRDGSHVSQVLRGGSNVSYVLRDMPPGHCHSTAYDEDTRQPKQN